MSRSSRSAGAGQASPEFVGIVIVVALMLAAVAAVVPRMHLGAPPPVIAHAAAPLQAPPPPVPARVVRGLSFHDALEVQRQNGPLERIARWAGRDKPLWRRIVANPYAIEFLRGGQDAVFGEVEAIADDPIGYGKDLITPPSRRDAEDLVERLRGIPAYVRELRGMPRDEALRRLSRDAGREGTRLAISLLRRKLHRAVRDRLDHRRDRGTTREPDPTGARP